MSLGDYVAVDSTELCLAEGETVEVLRVGSHGWWYARLLATGAEGWVPSTYLEPVPPQQQSADSSSGKAGRVAQPAVSECSVAGGLYCVLSQLCSQQALSGCL